MIWRSQVLGEGNCGSGDRPWEGSLRMCSLKERVGNRTGNSKVAITLRRDDRTARPRFCFRRVSKPTFGSSPAAFSPKLRGYPRTKVRNLVALGVDLDMAIKHAVSRKRYWRMSRTPAMRYAMPNKWLAQ